MLPHVAVGKAARALCGAVFCRSNMVASRTKPNAVAATAARTLRRMNADESARMIIIASTIIPLRGLAACSGLSSWVMVSFLLTRFLLRPSHSLGCITHITTP
jgi:hypothetical protein